MRYSPGSAPHNVTIVGDTCVLQTNRPLETKVGMTGAEGDEGGGRNEEKTKTRRRRRAEAQGFARQASDKWRKRGSWAASTNQGEYKRTHTHPWHTAHKTYMCGVTYFCFFM